MKLVKYMVLMSKLSKIEGRKETLNGEQNLSTKMLRRGVINDEDFRRKSESFSSELKTLEHHKWVALRHYVAA